MTELRAIDSGSPIKSVARAAYRYGATYSSLLIFALLCLCWSMLAVPLHALLPRALGRRLGRRGIMGGFRLYAHWLELAVQTLLIETDSSYLGKGGSPWARTSLPMAYRIRLGRRFEPPADAAAFSVELERYFRTELQQDTCR
jgi:hypothetical protein